MEEWIGGWWDKAIRHVAYNGFPAERVVLEEVLPVAPMYFRALGGAPAMSVKASSQRAHGAARHWLAKLAGTGEHTHPCLIDDTTVQLPPHIDYFPHRPLNQDLYFWLLALATVEVPAGQHWLTHNRLATVATLARFPGLRQRYQALVQAHLSQRPAPDTLQGTAAAQEFVIRQALLQPDLALVWPEGKARHNPAPVPLWCFPTEASQPAAARQHQDVQHDPTPKDDEEQDKQRRHAQQVNPDNRKDGMLLQFRAESLFTWDEYIKVNRHEDDDENDDARKAADDMQTLSITEGGHTLKTRLKFDLDLPSPDVDDTPVGPGLRVPEWDYKLQQLKQDHCRIQPMLPKDAVAQPLPEHLKACARQLRRQFEVLQPVMQRMYAQPQGDEIDLDAYSRYQSDLKSGITPQAQGLYTDRQGVQRDLACLLLADLSLSTDTWVNNDQRVIDVIRDSLLLFAEALSVTRDRFALYGFSSIKRDNVRLSLLKDFADRWDAQALGRVVAIKPGFYTRMGAAIRQSTRILTGQKAEKQVLLLLTDGKPNDLDHYEGRFGIEDTRQAVLEARAAGCIPFCVTIDPDGHDYLPYLFGQDGFIKIEHAASLPMLLPKLYLKLRNRH
ncbi:nitric oxide reductase activation protein NorD [Leeia oryzae]|uniref:nitric oxide reductase activation protein NorD n=1 Tax=Leeia oryzae TaxID=356662 RepID=UPI000379C6CC|nr:VWA domain-containing protein [Leeia oryzae]